MAAARLVSTCSIVRAPKITEVTCGRAMSHARLTADGIAAELIALATVVREAELPALAAGLVDGRQLDEITIFVIDDAPTAALVV